jgi:hypothetical protein
MRDAHQNAMPEIVDIAKNICAAFLFVIRSLNDRRAVDVIATDRGRPKARFADSESRFLAIKKFSCEPAWRRLGARQNRFFGRIAAADSRGAIFLSRCSASL